MHWLIDGHNLIGQLPNIHLSDPNDEEELIACLRRYRARTGHRLTVIFDTGQSYRPGEAKKQGGITVQFAPQGRTADQIIMRRLRKVKNPQEMMVVTSDRAVQQAARHAGVRWVTAREFGQQLQQLFRRTEPDQADSQADVRLSADEVEEWLSIFNQRKA